MKEWKGTKGECWFEFSQFSQISPNGQSIIKVGEVGTPIAILPMPIGGINTKEKNQANAELITDAFNTMNKCGIMPSELLEQRNELLEACKEALKIFPERAKKGLYATEVELLEKAISKCTGK